MERLAARLIARLGAEHEDAIVEEILRATYDAGSTLRDIEDAAPRLQ